MPNSVTFRDVRDLDTELACLEDVLVPRVGDHVTLHVKVTSDQYRADAAHAYSHYTVRDVVIHYRKTLGARATSIADVIVGARDDD